MFLIPFAQIKRLVKQAEAALPTEASGLLLRREVRGSAILSVAGMSSAENTATSFLIRDAEIKKLAAKLEGSKEKICGCFHSHVTGTARPSSGDNAATKKTGDLWLIYSVRFRDLKLFEWEGAAFQMAQFKILATLQ